VWVFYSLLSAFFFATADALSKKVLLRADERIVAWSRFLFASPFLLALLIVVRLPPLDGPFWGAMLALIPLEVVALLLYLRAIKVSPLSLTIPFLSLTPVFLVVSGRILLGERIGPVGGAGIGLIVAGGYLLQIHAVRGGWLGPVRAILAEEGSRLMILVAAIYSLTSALGKVAILHSSPAAFAILYLPVLAAAAAPVVLLTAGPSLPQLRIHWGLLFAIGFAEAAMTIFHCLAISQVQAAYMIAVKRTSLIFSVGYGYILFNETRIRQRLAGSLLMLAGVALISMRN
jgi:drug/metabolite transporter (DMT)-like permease